MSVEYVQIKEETPVISFLDLEVGDWFRRIDDAKLRLKVSPTSYYYVAGQTVTTPQGGSGLRYVRVRGKFTWEDEV